MHQALHTRTHTRARCHSLAPFMCFYSVYTYECVPVRVCIFLGVASTVAASQLERSRKINERQMERMFQLEDKLQAAQV